MSQPAEPINPYDSPATVRPGMSSGAKVLIGLGVGCGVLVLLCCGVGGALTFYFSRSFQHAMSKDPATVRQVAESIVEIDVPESLEPKVSLDWTVPILNKRGAMAAFVDRDEHSSLVLFQLDESLGNAEVMKTQFNESIRESGQKEMKEVAIEDSETFNSQINGSEAEFTVGKGKNQQSGREVWQATGAFDGKDGPAMLFMQLDAADFTKDQVMDVLKSMK
jgi:hypothetical protein